MHTDQFTATGLPFQGSGFPNTGFSTTQLPPAIIRLANVFRRLFRREEITEKGSKFKYGVNVQGNQCGVYGESVEILSDRESKVEGVGVHGFGENFGVIGTGRRGIAGVFGEHNQGGTGVLGAAIEAGVGVVGASVSNLEDRFKTLHSISDPADGKEDNVVYGKGIGVFGKSGQGAGVCGSSTNGAGVLGKSDQGPGVSAKSNRDRGGVFESGENIAQIHLVPLQQGAGRPQLPEDGMVGDLLLIRNTEQAGDFLSSDQCSLWLCIPSTVALGGARWREVMLGQTVAGTLPIR